MSFRTRECIMQSYQGRNELARFIARVCPHRLILIVVIALLCTTGNMAMAGPAKHMDSGNQDAAFPDEWPDRTEQKRVGALQCSGSYARSKEHLDIRGDLGALDTLWAIHLRKSHYEGDAA